MYCQPFIKPVNYLLKKSYTLTPVSRGRIFSQFENELVPSWERGIWEKH
jgi:hypothetical protein